MADPIEPASPLRIGIDIGGTFTDFVVYDPGSGGLTSFKVASTPHNPAEAVLAGLQQISNLDSPDAFSIIHGSTVATNALLERKGARTALITTKGFRDVLEIGRQNRPDIYDLAPKLPPPLVPAKLRFELDERVDATGAVLQPLDSSDFQSSIFDLLDIDNRKLKIESIAVCFLFSFLHPEHEQAVAKALRTAGYFVSASHEILPEYREYERTATTVVNAYVSPIMARYLNSLEEGLGRTADGGPKTGKASAPRPPSPVLRIMQSNGGIISPEQARREAVRCILSGPAGGLVAAQNSPLSLAGEGAGVRVLTFDMGGTSTDVSLIRGEPQITTEAEIGGLPIRVPVLDIHTIGAGGGSIASIDPAGGLRVGPESAGANPGPACYGRTEDGSQQTEPRPQSSVPGLPTVTDANLVLARLHPAHFLGGQMPLYPARAEAAIRPLADQLGLSLEQTALGIIQIANAHMARALRVISVERGHDPADFSLVSFGGAGGLHAADLARELGIPQVIVPRHASTFSALGMLQADVVKDYSRTVMLPEQTPVSNIQSAVGPMLDQARADLQEEGRAEADISLEASLDIRFRGQSYELNVPFGDNWQEAFDQLYQETYGYAPPGGVREIVNLRVRARGAVESPRILAKPLTPGDGAAALMGTRPIYFEQGFIQTNMYDADKLLPGTTLSGPALIIRSDTTILVGLHDQVHVDQFENLVIQIT